MQEPFSNPIHWSGSMCDSRCFSQAMPFLCEPFAPYSQIGIELFNGSCRLNGELALPFRVARISRLIGNFDTTAKPFAWQEAFVDQQGSIVTLQGVATLRQARGASNAYKTPLLRVAFAILRRSLASRSRWWAMVFPPRRLQAFPAGFPCLGTAPVAVALAGCPLCFKLLLES